MSKFSEKIMQIVKAVPKGYVVSYGQIALMAGVPKAAQAVGQVLHDIGEQTPWWRVINNAGRISTRCVAHPVNMQKRLLEKDGVKVTKNLRIDIEKYRWLPRQKTLKQFELDDKYIEMLMDKYFYRV